VNALQYVLHGMANTNSFVSLW